MLILTEKPSVAKDFANALICVKNNGIYENTQQDITIVNCIGHLFSLYSPKDYNPQFEDWHTLPIIPQNFFYNITPSVEAQAKLVIRILREHRDDKIIIATDADREGEIIARECLIQSNVCKTSNMYRFWVSQALTEDVIKEGLQKVKHLYEYDSLAKKGFARQHADWLIGMNFTRYITSATNRLLPVGRVQTAILSAINDRCLSIRNFTSKKYYEIYGTFSENITPGISIKGIYFENQNDTHLKDTSILESLKKLQGNKASLVSKNIHEKNNLTPQLYNLNAIQKDAFRCFGYSAEQTLNIVQSLYEDLKCVSYPRTPSRVMGELNVDLCKSIYNQLINLYPEYASTKDDIDISLNNKRCFNDKLLEAHHALIPLKELKDNVSEEQRNIYNLILERFMMAFLPEEKYKFIECNIKVNSYLFKITGKKIVEHGWKNNKYNWKSIKLNSDKEEQDLTKIDFDNLYLNDVEAVEKWTIPPKYFNEATILSFMENPKNVDSSSNQKLVGLGTPATRHTFIPKLIKSGYVKFDKKNIVTTELGERFLNLVKKSNIHEIASVEQTTNWEEQLEKNPDTFYKNIVSYVNDSVQEDLKVEGIRFDSDKLYCPICHREIRKGKSNWYCTGYKNGCRFPSIWNTISGAKISPLDVKKLIEGKTTAIKKCKSKTGKSFTCKFKLNSEYKIEFVFN